MPVFVFRSAPGFNNDWIFQKDGKVIITWPAPKTPFDPHHSIDDLKKNLMACDPHITPPMATSRARQIQLALLEIKIGTWIIHPTEKGSLINIGVVSGAYEFENEWHIPYHHSWKVDWICGNLPVSCIGTDWLKALNRAATIYSIDAPNAVHEIMDICRRNSNSGAEFIESTLKRWIPEDLNPPATTKAVKTSKKEKKSVKTNPPTADAPPKAAYLLKLIEHIRTQIDHNSQKHLVREIIKHIYRAQGSIIERINHPDFMLDEFIVQPSDNLELSTEKLILHRIPMSSGITREAVLRCFESMQSQRINKGLVISWGERGKGPHALSEYAAKYNIQLMSGDELILMLAKYHTLISDRLRTHLPDKQIFILKNELMK